MHFKNASGCRRFMIISLQRSGSHFLRGLLDSNPNIEAFGEIFHQNPMIRSRHLSTHNKIRPFSSKDSVETYLNSVVFKEYPDDLMALGFKYVYLYEPHEKISRFKILDNFLKTMPFSKIYKTNIYEKALWRQLCDYFKSNGAYILHPIRWNLLNRYLSQRLASESNAWINIRGSDDSVRDESLKKKYKKPVHLRPSDVLKDIRLASAAQMKIREMFKQGLYREISFENLQENTEEEIKGVLEFLGIPNAKLVSDTRKQRKGQQREWISNYDELKKDLVGTDAENFFE
jgi:hypothetical protein